MKIGKLQRGNEQGGVGVPNMQLYYRAAQTRYIYEWMNPDFTNTWIDMESENCGILTLKDCPFVNYKKVKLKIQNNFIVLNTLHTWNKFKVYFRLKNHFHFLLPYGEIPVPPNATIRCLYYGGKRACTNLVQEEQ